MAYWSQFSLQEGIGLLIELIIYFHDYIIIILTIIIVFVSYIFCIVLMNKGVDKYLVDSHSLEFVWTVLPIVFLVFIALPSLYLLYITEDLLSYGVVVKVVGHQWYWSYEQSLLDYPLLGFNSYIETSHNYDSYRLLDVDNRLTLPYKVGCMIMVTSADVLHSWTVPSMGVKVDAIPGRLNYLNLLPVNFGVFYGQCSELCGRNHSFMPIVVEVVTNQGYITDMYEEIDHATS